jgi:hypothetical protein
VGRPVDTDPDRQPDQAEQGPGGGNKCFDRSQQMERDHQQQRRQQALGGIDFLAHYDSSFWELR